MPILGIMASQISGHLAPSILGTTWAAGGAMPSSANWTSGSNGASLLVFSTNDSTALATTSNGTSAYTSRTGANISGSFMKYGGGVYLSAGGTLCQTSSDGTTWTARSSGISNAFHPSYGTSSNVWVIFNASGTSARYSTDNGVTWGATTLSTSVTVRGANGNGTTIVCSPNPGQNTSYTTNGTTWSTGSMPSSLDWGYVAASTTTFACIEYYNSSNVAATSTDGNTWTARTLSATASWYRILWTGVNFIAWGLAGNCCTSPTGVTWTTRTFPTGDFYGMGTNNSTLLATPRYAATTTQYSIG